MNNELRNSDEEREIDLIDLFKYFLKHWIVICLCTLLGLVASGIITRFFIAPKYSSSSLVYIRGTSSTIASLSDLQIGSYLTDDYVIVFKSRTVLQSVINKLNLNDITYTKLADMVEVSNTAGKNIIKVSITTKDPNLSRDIVNAVVDYGVNMVKEINTKEPYIVERAIANPIKVSPSMAKNVAIGGLLGLIISLGIYTVSYLVNDRINDIETIENKLGISVIGSIPEAASLTYDKNSNKKKKKHSSKSEKEKK